MIYYLLTLLLRLNYDWSIEGIKLAEKDIYNNSRQETMVRREDTALLEKVKENRELFHLLADAPEGIKESIWKVLEAFNEIEDPQECFEAPTKKELLEGFRDRFQQVWIYKKNSELPELLVYGLAFLDKIDNLEQTKIEIPDLDIDEEEEDEEFSFSCNLRLHNGSVMTLYTTNEVTRDTLDMIFDELPDYLEGKRKFTLFKKGANEDLEPTTAHCDDTLYLGTFDRVKSKEKGIKFVNRKEISDLSWTLPVMGPKKMFSFLEVETAADVSYSSAWRNKIHYVNILANGSKHYAGEWRYKKLPGINGNTIVPTRKTKDYLDDLYANLFTMGYDDDSQDDIINSKKELFPWENRVETVVLHGFSNIVPYTLRTSEVIRRHTNNDFKIVISAASRDYIEVMSIFKNASRRYMKIDLQGQTRKEYECSWNHEDNTITCKENKVVGSCCANEVDDLIYSSSHAAHSSSSYSHPNTPAFKEKKKGELSPEKIKEEMEQVL